VHDLQLWLHVVSSGVILGATVIFAMLVGYVREAGEPAEQRRRLAALARVWDPLVIGVLGISLMTGAFNLTDYKARLGPRFFAELGGVLGAKLALTFLAVMVATSIAFGIGHRTVREELGEHPLDPGALSSRLRRLPMLLWTLAVLLALVFALGLETSH
jgi:hypothetical protein